MATRRTYLKLVNELETTVADQGRKIARLTRQNEKLKARCVAAGLNKTSMAKRNKHHTEVKR